MLSKADAQATDRLKASVISTDFLKEYRAFVATIKQNAATDNDLKEFLDSVKIAGGIGGGRVLTDSNKPGFLFLPVDIIRGGYRLIGLSDKELVVSAKKIIPGDEELKTDVLLSRSTAQNLESFLAKPFFASTDLNSPVRDRPAQVYLITGTGINRIFNNTIPDPDNADSYYGTQFGATTYFPGRPYFQGAVAAAQTIRPLVKEEAGASGDTPSGPLSVGDYFYVSRPYMDLGGNGIVVTASRLLTAHSTCPAALCLDFRVQGTGSLSETLSTTIREFRAPRVKVRFRVNTKTHYVEAPEVIEPSSGSLSQVEKELVEHASKFIQDESLDLASFFGNIQLINQGAFSQASSSDTPLQVSIPVGNVGSQSAEKFGEFLLFQLDLAGYRHTTDLIGFAGCTCLALFSIVLVSGLVLTVQRNEDLSMANNELRQAFEEVGAVLWDAPVPYAQLDSQDRVRNCNRALCDLLGYEYQALLSKKFRDDLVHQEDWTKYDGVQEKRRKGESVDAYPLRFLKASGEVASVWVVAAPVPSTAAGVVGALPETFGIFLPQRPSGAKVVPIDKAKAV